MTYLFAFAVDEHLVGPSSSASSASPTRDWHASVASKAEPAGPTGKLIDRLSSGVNSCGCAALLCVWLYAAVCGCVRLCAAVCGCVRLCAAVCGCVCHCVWLRVAVHAGRHGGLVTEQQEALGSNLPCPHCCDRCGLRQPALVRLRRPNHACTAACSRDRGT